MTEEWRPCPDFEHAYEVSDLGRVRSRARGPVRILALGHDSDGYSTVAMNKDGRRTTRTVHRLVCRAFHGEPIAPWREAAHLDGTRTNCRADNLKWVGKRQNHFHRRVHGTAPIGEKSPCAKLTEREALDILALRHVRSAALAQRFGVSPNTIRDIWRGSRWGHLQQQSLSQGGPEHGR